MTTKRVIYPIREVDRLIKCQFGGGHMAPRRGATVSVHYGNVCAQHAEVLADFARPRPIGRERHGVPKP